MNSTPQYQRGDLRIASFLFAGLVTLGGILALARPTAHAAEVYTVRLSVGASGFEPRRVAVPMGAVHFVVTAREGDHCFAIPSLDVETRVRASKPLEVDVSFDRVGEFPFLCCVEAAGSQETGVVVVTPGK